MFDSIASDGFVTWLATNMFDIAYQYDDAYLNYNNNKYKISGILLIASNV